MKSLPRKLAAAWFMAAVLLLSAGCSRDDRSAGQTIDDTAITAKINGAYAKDPGVKMGDVKVVTRQGVVQLSGWAVSAEEKARAEELA